MADYRKQDPTEMECSVDTGKMAADTDMIKGKGKFSKAQLADNVTQPYTTGAMPDQGKVGGMARHPGSGASTK